MSRSHSRHEGAAGSRPEAAELREWIEDFVAVHRSHRLEECVAALTQAGFAMPPSDGWERLQEVWDKAQQEVLDNWRF